MALSQTGDPFIPYWCRIYFGPGGGGLQDSKHPGVRGGSGWGERKGDCKKGDDCEMLRDGGPGVAKPEKKAPKANAKAKSTPKKPAADVAPGW